MESLDTIVAGEIVPCGPLKAVRRVAGVGRISVIGTVECDRISRADLRTEARNPSSRIVSDIYLSPRQFRGNDFPPIVDSDDGMAGPVLV